MRTARSGTDMFTPRARLLSHRKPHRSHSGGVARSLSDEENEEGFATSASARSRAAGSTVRRHSVGAGPRPAASARAGVSLSEDDIIALYDALQLEQTSSHQLTTSHLTPVVGWHSSSSGELQRPIQSWHLYTVRIPLTWPNSECPEIKLGGSTKLALRHKKGFLAYVERVDDHQRSHKVAELRLCPQLPERVRPKTETNGVEEENPIQSGLRFQVVNGGVNTGESVVVQAAAKPAQEGAVRIRYNSVTNKLLPAPPKVDLRRALTRLHKLFASPRRHQFEPPELEPVIRAFKRPNSIHVYDFELENETGWKRRAPIEWDEALQLAWCFKGDFQKSGTKVGRVTAIGEDTLEIKPIPSQVKERIHGEVDPDAFFEPDRGSLWWAILPDSERDGQWIIHLLGYEAGLICESEDPMVMRHARIKRVGQSWREASAWWDTTTDKAGSSLKLDMSELCTWD